MQLSDKPNGGITLSKYDSGIDSGIRDGLEHTEIAKKIFLCYPTKVFENNEDLEFDILSLVSRFFGVQYVNVQIVGSSKTGKSYHKASTFDPAVSDLDLAIIDSSQFIKYMFLSSKVTRNYRDLTKFKDADSHKLFINYLSKGIFRPDLMPRCKEKSVWFGFFNELSQNYSDYFAGINSCIYADFPFFEEKQSTVVSSYLTSRSKTEEAK